MLDLVDSMKSIGDRRLNYGETVGQIRRKYHVAKNLPSCKIWLISMNLRFVSYG